jgi:uncharacterized protein
VNVDAKLGDGDFTVLTKTFCHLRRIGETTERNLWAAGVTSWEALPPARGCRLPRAIAEEWPRLMEESRAMLTARNPAYFDQHLPPSQRWRLYGDFADACAFLDIETTGLSLDDEITTAVLYDGRTIRYYVNGRNLDDFPRDLALYRILVTYNGASFDVPVIQRFFNVRLTQGHIDLRFPLRSLNLAGGLKTCERLLGLQRPGCEEIDGQMAVWLWHEYRRHKNERALETLLAYNINDAVTLLPLMVHAYNEKRAGTPFGNGDGLPMPVKPELPFQADRQLVDRMFQRSAWGSY